MAELLQCLGSGLLRGRLHDRLQGPRRADWRKPKLGQIHGRRRRRPISLDSISSANSSADSARGTPSSFRPHSLQTALANGLRRRRRRHPHGNGPRAGLPRPTMRPLAASFEPSGLALADAAAKNTRPPKAAARLAEDQREFAQFSEQYRARRAGADDFRYAARDGASPTGFLAQIDFEFRKSFLAFLKDNYAAPLERTKDFTHDSEAGRIAINAMGGKSKRRQRIRDLIPSAAVDGTTRPPCWSMRFYLKAAVGRPILRSR